MKANNRRKELAELLMASKEPLSGGALSEQLKVSRQIIVQDIAILKAAGYDIISTHYGYVMQKTPLCERVFKVKHSGEQTEDELNTIVELGGSVVDVFVRHKVYGTIDAKLNIFTKRHVEDFIDRIRSGKSTELMSITGGFHYHTVRCENEAVMLRIAQALAVKGYLVPEKAENGV
jgi:transcriptional regulator of NAD metabolism